MAQQDKEYTLALEMVQRLQATVVDLRKKAKIEPLAATTVREYERRWERLRDVKQEPLDIGPMCKKERYLWKAAGDWGFKTQIKDLLREADRIRAQKQIDEKERMGGWKATVEKLTVVGDQWKNFQAISWMPEPGCEVIRKQKHKKPPATDAQLDDFFATPATARSMYHDHFVAMEFCGARPEEFGGVGLGVELRKYQGNKLALRFWIEGAKQGDGSNGQPLRTVLVPFPDHASKAIGRRWKALADRAATQPERRFLLTVEEGGTTTAGQKVSRAFANCVKKTEGVGRTLSAYSLRNRVSAQAKASNDDPECIAEILGHQSVETQSNYGRAHRGGKGISPVQLVSDGAGDLKPVRNRRDKKAGPSIGKVASVQASTPASSSPAGMSVASWRSSSAAQSQPTPPPKPLKPPKHH